MTNGITRFSNKAKSYDRYRPQYPSELIDYIQNILITRESVIVADIGSGTGLFTKQIIHLCEKIYGIEPNTKMRNVAKKSLAGNNKFISINGTAEDTSLASNSIDCITVSQAFHWFDKQKCKSEFQKILKDNGLVILLWNSRIHLSTEQPFLKDFDNILSDFVKEYKEKPLKINIEEIANFFNETGYKCFRCKNPYYLNFEQLMSTLISSSYIPDLSLGPLHPCRDEPVQGPFSGTLQTRLHARDDVPEVLAHQRHRERRPDGVPSYVL